MSDDESAGPADRPRPYNRPRRYPVQPPVSPAPDVEPLPAAEATRQNPTLAEAAQQYELRRYGTNSATPAAATPPASNPYPHPGTPSTPPAGPAGPSRAASRRGLLIGLAVLILIAAVGLVIGLSGGGDPAPSAATPDSAGNAPSATAAPTAPSTAPSTAETSPAPSTSTAGVGGTAASDICTRLTSTAPFIFYVADLRPAPRMPELYVEPPAAVRLAVCVGAFRPGAGAGRGHLAYLAEYQQLPAAQYAVTLKTLGWVLVPNLPRPTYRNNFTTTVTLVQQGTALVTVVGTGR